MIDDPPPKLPADQYFSPEFINFVTSWYVSTKINPFTSNSQNLFCSSLTKNYRKRPKYRKLLEDPFILKYERIDVDLISWYALTLSTNQVAATTVTTSTPSSSTNTTATPSSNPSPSYSNASTNTVASPTACLSPTYANASTNTPITSPIRKSVVCTELFSTTKHCFYFAGTPLLQLSQVSLMPRLRHQGGMVYSITLSSTIETRRIHDIRNTFLDTTSLLTSPSMEE